MRPYQEQFPKGSSVRIADRRVLDDFLREWKFHHKLETRQLGFAGAPAIVKRALFYHGGDVLYELEGAPGVWHERCLRADRAPS
jgi:hypothetical protein